MIIDRVAELAARYQVSMTEVSLAWLLSKVTAPVVGATKKQHVDGAVNALDLQLSSEDIHYLEACYQPHFLTGVMAQNSPETECPGCYSAPAEKLFYSILILVGAQGGQYQPLYAANWRLRRSKSADRYRVPGLGMLSQPGVTIIARYS